MIYDLITTYSSEEVQIYILDFGTEALKIYNGVPHIGDIVFINDSEKICRFFEMLQKIIKIRKEELSEYNGNYNLYLKTSGKKMPMIVVIMNNYEAFSEMYENEYDDIFITLTREGIKCGIVFVVTVSNYNDMRYRLSQNFKKRIALQLNKEDDYLNIFDRIGKKRPSHIFGRGLVSIDDDEQIYEFQTAKICSAEQYNEYIKNTIAKLIEKNNILADSIPVIPDRILLEDIKEYLKDLANVPLGITKKDLRICKYNFKKDFINMIASKNIQDATQFTLYLLQQLTELENVEIKIFDAERIISSKKTDIKYEYSQFIQNINKKTNKDILCVIIGVDKFVNDYDNINNNFSDNFYETLVKAETSENCNFIFVETESKLRNHEYDDWYKNYISKENGIWVGNGIENQYLITTSNDRRDLENNCGRSFGYAINQGNASLIKLLEMKESGESNE